MIRYYPLHSHSRYSALDGLSDIDEKVKRAKVKGLEGLSLTDHGTIAGSVKFYKSAKKQGLKPILGTEIYLVEDVEKARENKERHAHHLVLLAKNQTGWQNICQLVTQANKNFYYKPRVDLKILKEHSEGIIALTACMHGPVSYYLFDKKTTEVNADGEEISLLKEAANVPKAYQFASSLKQVFGDNLYLEVQDGGIPEQKGINERVREIAQQLGIKVVATQDDHYVLPEDHKAHSFLKAMAFGAKFAEEGSHGFSTQEFFLKGLEDIKAIGSFTDEEIEQTAKIADMCNVELSLGKMRLPKYPYIPEGNVDSMAYLKSIINKGWLERKIVDPNKVYRERVYREIKDVETAGIADYFLIVWDIINWARSQGIFVGPGRGSVGGSLIAYLLGITQIDPIQYGLIWERFYNAGRAGAFPDIDSDFEKNRREEVLDYIRSRFGENKVAQLVTISTLAARAVLKDVFRVAGIDFDLSNKITNLVPAKNEDHGAITLAEALETSEELKKYADNIDPIEVVANGKIVRKTSFKELFDIAIKLEGCVKTYGTHAAAVVISDKDFDKSDIPLVKSSTSDDMICGWDMEDVDALGLLKVDILGLTTLSVINRTLELIKLRHGKDISIYDIEKKDQKTFDLISSGRTEGVFQLESSLGRAWSKKLKPQSIDEIAELISLIRPGCLDCGMTETYAKVKSGEQQPSFIHPILKEILGNTRGVLIFQEQVMEICQKIAGMDLKQADTVRKSIGKKVPELLRQQKELFISGTAKKGIDSKIADEIWSWIETQAGYGFNKSHGVGYGLLSYQTAWLKANYYIEFLCANLIFAKDKANQQKTPQDVIASFINDGKLHDVDVVPPKLAHDNEDFDIVDEKTIAFGLSHIKSVGAAALKAIKTCSRGSSFHEFLMNAREAKLNKQVVTALICSGALDDFGETRRSMKNIFNFIDELTEKEYASVVQGWFLSSNIKKTFVDCAQTMITMQKSEGLFVPNKPRKEKLAELIEQFKKKNHADSMAQLLVWEKEYLGATISGNMADLNQTISSTHTCKEFATKPPVLKQNVVMCVTVEDMREHVIKKGNSAGKTMAFLRVSDSTYALENVVLFAETYARIKNDVEIGDVVVIKGKPSDKGGLVINSIVRA